MASQRQKSQMRDYLVGKLDGNGDKIEPCTNELISGINSNYLLLGEDEVVLLADQVYPRDSFQRLWNFLRRDKCVGVVVLKDGQTFFRSAAKRNYFKKNRGLSLKNYTDEDMYRMLLLRPEEVFLKNRGQVQYYQPDSDRLDECVVSFRFSPVIFDYSHITAPNRFKPQADSSRKLFISGNRNEIRGNLVLDANGMLIERND